MGTTDVMVPKGWAQKEFLVLVGYKTSGVTLLSWRPEISVSVTDIFFMISERKK